MITIISDYFPMDFVHFLTDSRETSVRSFPSITFAPLGRFSDLRHTSGDSASTAGAERNDLFALQIIGLQKCADDLRLLAPPDRISYIDRFVLTHILDASRDLRSCIVIVLLFLCPAVILGVIVQILPRIWLCRFDTIQLSFRRLLHLSGSFLCCTRCRK